MEPGRSRRSGKPRSSNRGAGPGDRADAARKAATAGRRPDQAGSGPSQALKHVRAAGRRSFRRDCEESGMGDITNIRLLYLKGGLFLVGGLLASGLLLLECPSAKVA